MFSASVFPVTVGMEPSRRPAATKSFITEGMPPMSKRSAAMYLPDGARSARKGILFETRWKSSRVKGTPAVPAMASIWRTALVEPPSTIIMTSAFSKEAFVRSLRGVMFFSIHTRMAAAALAHSRILAGDVAGVVEELGRVRPIAVIGQTLELQHASRRTFNRR